MRFGFPTPNRGAMATPEVLPTLLQKGEELGFAYTFVSDHIVVPNTIQSHYPYEQAGRFTAYASGCMEQLAELGYLAGITRNLGLLTSVMVVPHRHPIITAKALATIDVLSGGRLIVGCGAGWLAEEFQLVGAPPFEHRGRVTEEYIQAFKELWTSDSPDFDGEFVSFSDVSFLPKPVQKPHPPIWLGGDSPAAMRRAARVGDVWYPIGNNETYPLNTVQRYADAAIRLRAYAEREGRDPADVGLAYKCLKYNENEAVMLDNGERQVFSGSTDEIADDVKRFEDLGLENLTLGLTAPSLEETLARMERFAEEVMPKTTG